MSLLFRLFRANETRVHELNYLFWECTTRCNLHCRHCGSDCTESSGEKDMPFDDFLRALDTIPAAKRPHPFTVVITGGEPLLRPDLPEIGRTLRERGVGWSIVSNGWLYDEEMHHRLMAAGLGALTISLDGPGVRADNMEDDHDWLRGRPGSYARAIRAIAIAAKQDRLNFDVVTCVNQRNLPNLQEIHDKLATLGVRQWRIFTIIPIGRALDHPELHLTDEQFVQLMDFIAQKRSQQPTTNSQQPTVTFSCEGYLGPYESKVRQTPYFCHAGINIASVLIDGTICACPNIDRQHFGQGNIYTDNLWEVWNTRFQPFRNRDWARQGQCKHCKAFKDCLGNGMHNWHAVGDRQGANGNKVAMPGDTISLINCHYHKILHHKSSLPK